MPDPGDPLRQVRRGGRAGPGPAGGPARGRSFRPVGQSSGQPPDLEACPLPVVRRPRRARDRHPGHLRGQLLVFRPFRRSDRGGADRQGRGRLLAAGGPVYRRHRARGAASALFPLRHPGAEGRRPAVGGGAVRRAVHPGHGHARDLSPAERRVGRARPGGAHPGRGHARGPAGLHRRAAGDR